jgi:hypothetical protein
MKPGRQVFPGLLEEATDGRVEQPLDSFNAQPAEFSRATWSPTAGQSRRQKPWPPANHHAFNFAERRLSEGRLGGLTGIGNRDDVCHRAAGQAAFAIRETQHLGSSERHRIENLIRCDSHLLSRETDFVQQVPLCRECGITPDRDSAVLENRRAVKRPAKGEDVRTRAPHQRTAARLEQRVPRRIKADTVNDDGSRIEPAQAIELEDFVPTRLVRSLAQWIRKGESAGTARATARRSFSMRIEWAQS